MPQTILNPSGLSHGNILAILAAAILVRLFNAVSIDDLTAYAFIEDSPIYWDGAKAWLDSGYFSRATVDGFRTETERVPFYHMFLVFFRWTFGDTVFPVIVTQSLLDSFTCVLIGLLGSQLSREIGLLSGLLAAAWPNFVIHSQLLLSDSLFLFFFTGSLLFAAKYLRAARFIDAVLVGLLCGAAIMTRSVALYIPISMAVCGPFISWKLLGKWRPGVFAGIAMFIASLVFASPLIWRNMEQFGTYQLTAQSGSHFLNWIVGYVQSLDKGTTFSEETQEIQKKLREDSPSESGVSKPFNPFEAGAERVEFAKQEFKKIPIQSIVKAWLYGSALNLGTPALIMDPRIRAYNRNSLMNSKGSGLVARVMTFLEGNDPRYLTWVTIGLAVSFVAAMLQFFGWIVLLRAAFWPAIFGALAIAYFLLISGPIGSPKYRLPFEPVLIVFQAVAIRAIYDRLRPAKVFREDDV